MINFNSRLSNRNRLHKDHQSQHTPNIYQNVKGKKIEMELSKLQRNGNHITGVIAKGALASAKK